MKEKLAFVVDYYPYFGGYASRVVEQIKFLSKNFDIYFFYLFKRKNVDENCDISQYVIKEYRLETVSDEVKTLPKLAMNPLFLLRPAVIRNIFENVIDGSSLYFAPYISNSLRGELSRIMKTEGIDLIWVYGCISAILVKKIAAKFKVCDLCDSRTLWYATCRNIVKRPGWAILMQIDVRFTRKFEKEVGRYFNIVSFINKRDGEFVGYTRDEFLVLPNIRKLMPIKPQMRKTDLIMVGVWDYIPNYDALDYMIYEVMPKLDKALTLSVVGPIDEGRRKRFLQRVDKNISICGKVPDLRDYLASARIMVAPIRGGSGTQNKVLDAMEAGLPVLTTQFVKEGIDPQNECVGIIVCSNADDYALQIRKLLGNEEARGRLGQANIEFLKREVKKTEEIYRSLIEKMKRSDRGI